MKYRCFVPTEFEAFPLYFALSQNILPHNFQILPYKSKDELPSEENERVLMLVDTYTVAQIPGKLWTIPNISFTMMDKSLHYRLFFNQSSDKWEKVKLTAGKPLMNLLAKIIIQEKFDMEPEFIVNSSDETSYDAYLLEGEPLFQKISGNKENYFDLVEEWYDFEGKPLPVYLWVTFDKEISPAVIDTLSKARDLGVKYLPDIAENNKLHPDLDWLEVYRFFTDHCTYNFTEKHEDALKAFWQYGFYYGEFQYVPEIKYVTPESD